MRGKLALILIVVIICIPLAANINNYVVNADVRKIQKELDFDLPKHTKVEYKRDYHGWFGEGIKYVVLDIEESSPDFLDTFKLTKEDQDYEVERQRFIEDMDNAIDIFDLKIDMEYRLDWDTNLYFKETGINKTVFVVYVPDRSELVVCEVIE